MVEEKEKEQETNRMSKEEEQVIRWTGKESSTVYKDYQYRRFVGLREGRAYERRRGRRRLWVWGKQTARRQRVVADKVWRSRCRSKRGLRDLGIADLGKQ